MRLLGCQLLISLFVTTRTCLPGGGQDCGCPGCCQMSYGNSYAPPKAYQPGSDGYQTHFHDADAYAAGPVHDGQSSDEASAGYHSYPAAPTQPPYTPPETHPKLIAPSSGYISAVKEKPVKNPFDNPTIHPYSPVFNAFNSNAPAARKPISPPGMQPEHPAVLVASANSQDGEQQVLLKSLNAKSVPSREKQMRESLPKNLKDGHFEVRQVKHIPSKEKEGYLTYYNQQCSGTVMESSRDESISSASSRCASLGCEAANARPQGDGKYEVAFLRAVDGRVNKRGVYCVSNIKVPLKSVRTIREETSDDETLHLKMSDADLEEDNEENGEDEKLSLAIDRLESVDQKDDVTEFAKDKQFNELSLKFLEEMRKEDEKRNKTTTVSDESNSTTVASTASNSSHTTTSRTLPPSFFEAFRRLI